MCRERNKNNVRMLQTLCCQKTWQPAETENRLWNIQTTKRGLWSPHTHNPGSVKSRLCNPQWRNTQSADAHLDHDWISGLRMRRMTVHAETKPTTSDTESLAPNVEILSEKMQEVEQKLAEHLNAAATNSTRIRHRGGLRGHHTPTPSNLTSG